MGHGEPLEIRTHDGVALAATLLEAPQATARGTVIMAHAMFARQSAFRRPAGRGLAERMHERGWSVLLFDFRGHGGSKAESYGYDDFVQRDLPAVVECVRARSRGPVALLGHSLGAHVALASVGCGLCELDALVLAAANVWLRDFEPNGAIWTLKRATLEGFVRTARRVGKFPARALRLGSDDEALGYVEDLARFGLEGKWRSRDGARDYLAALGNVHAPVYAIASDGDLLNARPVCVERMVARCRGPIHIDRVRRSDDGSRPPGHGALVTTDRAASAFARAEEFLRQLG